MKIIVICVLAALMLASVSCSEQPGASATRRAASVDPCKLLTRDEAAAALNEQVGAPAQENNNPDLMCTYANAAADHNISVTTSTGSAAQKEFKAVNDLVAHDMAVEDIGDTAFISKLREIHVLAGDTYFAIRIKDDSPMALPKTAGRELPPGADRLPQATRDKLTAMARKAVARL
ncbi:MAG: hypothetical protein ACR2LC_08370 [Pyrinomonadaceae bacterium]